MQLRGLLAAEAFSQRCNWFDALGAPALRPHLTVTFAGKPIRRSVCPVRHVVSTWIKWTGAHLIMLGRRESAGCNFILQIWPRPHLSKRASLSKTRVSTTPMQPKIFSIRRWLLLALLPLTVSAHAIDCGPYKVVAIQAQTTDVLVLLRSATGQGGDFWKSLGLWSSSSTRPYLAIVQQALATDRWISLRYADPYICSATDYSTQPHMVRLELTVQ